MKFLPSPFTRQILPRTCETVKSVKSLMHDSHNFSPDSLSTRDLHKLQNVELDPAAACLLQLHGTPMFAP